MCGLSLGAVFPTPSAQRSISTLEVGTVKIHVGLYLRSGATLGGR